MSDLERMIEILSKTQASIMNNHHQATNRLKVQIGQLANSLNERQKGTLPSQPLPNPKNPFPIHEAEDIGPKKCNTTHILRSEKQVDNQVFSHPVPNTPVSSSPIIIPQA